MIDQDELRTLFHYNPDTGIFTWRIVGGIKAVGSIAGYIDHEGYRRVTFHRKAHRMHRLAWLYVHGELPPNEIDHINGIRDDNRLCNLRAVICGDNLKNKAMQKNNTSGVVGVHWSKKSKKWLARIKVSSKEIYLGAYDDLELAELVRAEAEIKYGFHPNHGRPSLGYA